MNRRLVLFASGVMVSAAVTVAADVPAVPHPIGPPVVYAITPNSGTTAGGRWVNIFGRDFNGATGVTFGSKPAARFFLISSGYVFARSPSGVAGTVVDVTVTTPLGTSATSLADSYTYAVVPPVIDAVDPRQGTAAGGTRVILNGHGVWGATAVNFGAVTIPCFFPPASAATLPSSEGDGKLDPATLDRLQRFDSATLDLSRRLDGLTLASPGGSGTLDPRSGSAAGPGGGRCMPFGDDVHLIVFSPPGTANTTVDITITTPVGTSPTGPGARFAYVAPVAPVVKAIGPGHGSANGGTNVTLFGSGFSGATSVNFGANAVQKCPGPFGPTPAILQRGRATRLEVERAIAAGPGGPCFFPSGDDSRLFLQSPPGNVGVVDVTVTSGAGTSSTSPATKYTNDQPGPPEVNALTPSHGSALGGGQVHIQGSSLTGATTVKFGSTAIPPCGPSVSRTCFFGGDDNNLFVGAAPPGPANTMVDVTVTVGAVTSAAGPADMFAFDTATVPVIQAIDPTHGVPNGGTNVNLVGKGFASVTSLTIGPVTMAPCPSPGPCFFVGSDNTMTFTTPVKTFGVPSVVPVTVTNAIGASAPLNFTYDLMGGPVVTGVSPSSGPTSGNTSVWVTGSGFSQASGVTFDVGSASYVAGFNVPPGSDTVMQVFTPQVPPGTTLVNIRVKSPSVTSPITAADQYTFLPVTAVIPTVSAVTPSTGPTNSFVALYGSGFSMATKVMFGTVPAFGLFVPNDHLIVTSSPPPGPGATGTVQIFVTTPAGTNAAGATYTFGTTPAGPQVGGLDPFQGTHSGGTNMNIYGVGFNFTASVTFGSTTVLPCGFGQPPPCFNVNGDNYIYVNTPPQGANPAQVDVRVSVMPLGGGSPVTSPIVAADNFTWVAPVAPAVNALDPQQASTFGGTGLTVYGSGFSAATAVKVGPNTVPPCGPFGSGGGFGGVCFFIGGDSQISLGMPPSSPGTVEVTVTTPTGTSALNPPTDQLTYVTPGPPTISGITPSNGPSSGGTVTYISGSNLQGAFVTFGPNPSFNIIYYLSSPTLLAVVSPPGGAGTVPLTVTTPSGSAAGQFTYIQSPAPSIATVGPNHGSADGGTQVLITGNALGGANAVSFGSNRTFNFFAPFDFFSLSPGPLMATSPPGPGGTTVDVSVTTPAGTSAATPMDQFAYDALGLPVVNALSPNSGMTEGDELFISGSNLASATRINFGTTGVSNFNFFPVAQGVLSAFSPPGTPGTVDVTVMTPAGTSAKSANDAYTYVATPRPVVSVISPSHGPPGTFVWISGTSLEANKMGDVVKFGTAVPDVFSQGSGGVMNANSPPPPPGSPTVDVTVTNDGGTSATSPADLYTFDPAQPPTVTVIAPDSGPAGTRVFITGTNLGGTTEVDFGSDLATSIFVLSDTLVIATSPCNNGRVDVIVKTAAGAATSPNKFKHRRCRAEGEQQGNNNNRNENNTPPIPPGPPSSHPRSASTSSGPSTTVQSLPAQGATTPTDLTASISAIWLRLRGMSALFGGP